MEHQSREIELKFELVPGDARRIASLALLDGAAPAVVDQVSTYFDTRSGRLAKAGLTLRIRRADGKLVQTVKSEGPSRALFDRGEWECEVSGLSPDHAALALTPAAEVLNRKHKALLPAFTVDVRRSRWIIAEDGAEVELVLDNGKVEGGEAELSICEIELELVRGHPALLFELARAIDAAVPIRVGVLSKSERGARLIGGSAGRISKAEPVRLEPAMRSDDAFVSIAWNCIRHFRLNEPLLLATGDAEALHQARVALRRLRSAFSLFSKLLEGGESASIKAELRWAAGLLGEARDLDVFIAAHPDLEPLRRKELEERRKATLERALRGLESSRFRTLMIELVRWLMLGSWRERQRAAEPIAELASDILDRYRRKIRRAGGGDLAALDDHHRHLVRIEAKKLRYGSEFFARLFPGRKASKQRAHFLNLLEALQETLGELNDLATARDLHDDTIEPRPEQHREALLAAACKTYDELIAARPFWR